MRRLAGLFCAAGLLLVACGDDDDGQARTVESTTTTTAPDTTGADNGGDVGDSAVGDHGSDGSTPMSEVVLQLSDLPSGYAESPSDDDDNGDDSLDCADTDPWEDLEPVEEAESGFQQSEMGPFIASFAGRYESTDRAEEAMAAITEFIEACDGFTEVDDDGNETTYSVSALSFPALGDDTFAARLTMTSDFGPFTIDLVATRVGDVAVSMFNLGLGGGDTSQTEPLMRTMLNRL